MPSLFNIEYWIRKPALLNDVSKKITKKLCHAKKKTKTKVVLRNIWNDSKWKLKQEQTIYKRN